MQNDALTLYAVTDRHWLHGRTLAACVAEAIAGGATMVQLREKHLDDAAFIQEARALQPLCAAAHVPLIINDNLAVALAVDADGIHIGQNDTPPAAVRAAIGPNRLLGVSAQTAAEALAAEAAGADYLGVGAVFATATKPDAIDVPLPTLAAITAAVHIPVVAIGGIDAANLKQLRGSGIAGVAVVSALFAASDIRASAADLLARINALQA